MLKAAHITARLGKRQILHGVDFEAADGAVTAIVGPNGSGKTTLLRTITGELGYQGQITLDGEDMARMSGTDLASRRAVLPQATRIAFPFTVLEVVRLGLLTGLDAAMGDLPEQALAKVGLGGFGGRFYHELSGGEQQRCQLARVLVQVWSPVRSGRASWLFLDEPVSALDVGHQLEVMQIARAYANAGGAVIAVMHDLNLTAMFADSVALIDQGRCVLQGTPQTVLTNTHLAHAYLCDIQVSTPPSSPAMPYILPQSIRT